MLEQVAGRRAGAGDGRAARPLASWSSAPPRGAASSRPATTASSSSRELAPDHGADLSHRPGPRAGSRSSRASREAWERGRDGEPPARRSPACERSFPPASSTVLVSSSANSGTPSVRSTISSTSASGRSRPRDATHERCASAPVEAAQGQRGSVRLPRPGRPELGAVGDDQQQRQAAPRSSTMRSSSSRGVGSIQCTSSNSASTGSRRATPSSWRNSAARSAPAPCAGSGRGTACSGRRASTAARQQQAMSSAGVDAAPAAPPASRASSRAGPRASNPAAARAGR